MPKILRRTLLSQEANGLWHVPELEALGLRYLLTGRARDMAITKEGKEEAYFNEIQAELKAPLYMMRQVHGTDYAILDTNIRSSTSEALQTDRFYKVTRFHGIDGLVTQRKDVALGSTHADCAPLLLWDPVRGTLANLHSGWRGTLKGILPRVASDLQATGDLLAADAYLVLGPMIDGADYEVEADVAKPFAEQFQDAEVVWQTSKSKYRLSLKNALLAQARMLGISNDRVFCLESSTYSDPSYHSYRRDGRHGFGLMMSIAKIL